MFTRTSFGYRSVAKTASSIPGLIQLPPTAEAVSGGVVEQDDHLSLAQERVMGLRVISFDEPFGDEEPVVVRRRIGVDDPDMLSPSAQEVAESELRAEAVPVGVHVRGQHEARAGLDQVLHPVPEHLLSFLCRRAAGRRPPSCVNVRAEQVVHHTTSLNRRRSAFQRVAR